ADHHRSAAPVPAYRETPSCPRLLLRVRRSPPRCQPARADQESRGWLEVSLDGPCGQGADRASPDSGADLRMSRTSGFLSSSHMPIPAPGPQTSCEVSGAISLVLCVLAMGLWSCERDIPDKTPPLRPLVYTEAPPDEGDVVEVTDPLPSWIAPEDLGIAVFQALVEHDRELFEQVFVTGPELTELIRTPEEQAAEQSTQLISDSDIVCG